MESNTGKHSGNLTSTSTPLSIQQFMSAQYEVLRVFEIWNVRMKSPKLFSTCAKALHTQLELIYGGFIHIFTLRYDQKEENSAPRVSFALRYVSDRPRLNDAEYTPDMLTTRGLFSD